MKNFIKILLVLIGLAVAGFIGYKAIKYKLDPDKQLVKCKCHYRRSKEQAIGLPC